MATVIVAQKARVSKAGVTIYSSFFRDIQEPAKYDTRWIQPERRIAEMEDPFSRPLFASDVEVYGVETAIALAELSTSIAELNRSYRQAVQARALLSGDALNDWLGKSVRVFLRHDSVYVFAISFGRQFGMANRLLMQDVKFVVDRIGREQTLSLRGPLQNMTTVHAWLEGVLTGVSEIRRYR